MLGEIGADLIEALGIDVLGVWPTKNLFGFRNEGWKPWTTFDGTPVLVPAAFNTELEDNGDLLAYPEGDKSAPPSGRMPQGGFYFDTLIRQPPIDESRLKVEENLQEFDFISDEELTHFQTAVEKLNRKTDKAILANFGGTAFGDIALVPAPWMKNPKGIRDVSEWYMSTVARKDYVHAIFERQCEIALHNLARCHAAVGEGISVVFLTGTDFGTQLGPFISPKTYCDLYQPFQRRLNDWVHENTSWKTFIHSCGSVWRLIPYFIEAGFDILNPVQCSAAEMDPAALKNKFGGKLTFWGGGVDTQKTLPFGTPEEVQSEVRERIRLFAPAGGFIFNTIHNVQPGVPSENINVLFDTWRNWGNYPIKS
jgi:uroporphyrinogen-III decarboxylase